ncbi:MAG: hypothetical protein VKK42_24415 [Lyngbya sp.]|nr:hypothetical protein [Lyngbya sp.]
MLKKLQHRLNLVLGSIPFLAATLTVTSSPSEAATFASSSAQVSINNFSQAPARVATLTDGKISIFSTDGSANAIAEFDAFFSLTNPFAFNSSFAEAEGDGIEYRAKAYSEAAVIGYDFFIPAGSTFSFDFVSSLELETSIERPPGENAIAEVDISFWVYEEATDNLLDSFIVSGRLEAVDSDDFLVVDASHNFNFSLDDSEQKFGGNQEFITGEYVGNFSRYFSEDTSLRLMEVKTNYVLVKAPEPSSFVALFVFGGVMGVALRKRKQS